MFKNVAGQSIELQAFIPSTGLQKAGDAANITAYVSKDHGAYTILGDTTATEMDATKAKGKYLFALTQAETNADHLSFAAVSVTSDVVIVTKDMYTLPAYFSTMNLDSSGRALLQPTQPGVTIPVVSLVTATSLVNGLAANTLTASALATDAVTEIVAAIFARAFSAAYNSLTFDQLCKLIAAVELGKVSGGATTTMVFRNLADNADAVSATVDSSGNRASVVLTP